MKQLKGGREGEKGRGRGISLSPAGSWGSRDCDALVEVAGVEWWGRGWGGGGRCLGELHPIVGKYNGICVAQTSPLLLKPRIVFSGVKLVGACCDIYLNV